MIAGANWPRAAPDVWSQLLQWCEQPSTMRLLLDLAQERAVQVLDTEFELLPPLLPNHVWPPTPTVAAWSGDAGHSCGAAKAASLELADDSFAAVTLDSGAAGSGLPSSLLCADSLDV